MRKFPFSHIILALLVGGSAAVGAGKIVNGDIAASAAIAFSKLATLTSGNILVGSAGNVATSVAVTGDISLSNAGVTAYSGTVPVNKGGTGQTGFTDGQLLIGNSSGGGLTKATITAGTGISVTNGNGSITIASSGAAVGAITSFTQQVQATTTSPTKGTALTDQAVYQCVGNMLHVRYNYRQSGGSPADGSGTYIYPLPNSMRIDTTKTGALPYAASGWQAVGTGHWSSGSGGFVSSSNPTTVFIYDETHVFMAYLSSFNVMSVNGSVQEGMAGTSILNFHYVVPVTSCN